MLRVISEFRPRYVVAENVRGAVNLALDTVYSGLVAEGYKVYPYVIPASAVGAPHQRERLFVVGVREDVYRQYTEAMENPGCELRQRTEFSGSDGVETGNRDADKFERPSGTLWSTPTQRDYKGTSAEEGLIRNDGKSRMDQLPNAVKFRPTAQARDWKGSSGRSLKGNEIDLPTAIKTASIKTSGSLNPAWVSLLMGFPEWWTDPERGMLYATTIKTVTGEILYVVREENGAEVVRRPLRGYEHFSEEEVLLSSMRWEGEHEEASNQVCNREKANTPQRRKVQRMWQNLRIGNSPHRRRQIQQHLGELNDVVRYLSHEMALGEWQNHAEETVGLQNLWCSCQEVGYVPETLSALQEVWRSLSHQEKSLVVVCAMGRTPFPARMNELQYPYEFPRTTTGCKDRAKRLKALGNSVVPAQAYPFFRAIVEIEKIIKEEKR